MARKPTREQKLRELEQQMQQFIGGMEFRVNKTASGLDLASITQAAVLKALAQVPGALDVASRMTSPAMYGGLGAAFDQAAGEVDGGNGWEYTAVMDGGTCDVCAAVDGTTYATWEDAQADLPDGGPNPDCLGSTRCRCRLAPVPL